MTLETRNETRLLPQDPEAEAALIASLMVNPDLVWRVAALAEPGDFHREQNGWIYAAELALAQRNEAINQISVSGELARQGLLQPAGGMAYLSRLITDLPTSVGAEYYAKAVREASRRRKLIHCGHELVQRAWDGRTDSEKLLGETLSRLTGSIGEKREGRQSLGEMYTDWLKGENMAAAGVRLGFPSLERLIYQVPAGDVLVVAANTSVGKTAFALQVARNVAVGQRKTVALASFEMTPNSLALRLLAAESGVPMVRLQLGQAQLRDDEQRAVNHAMGVLADSEIQLVDCIGMTVQEVALEARRIQAQVGLDLLVIDYVQLMSSGQRTENATQEVARVSAGVKQIARDCNVPVLAVAQLRRRDEDSRPELRDLYQSGAIERDADEVLFLHWSNRNYRVTRPIEVIVAKNRNGPLNVVPMTFMAPTGKFVDPMDGGHE